MIDAFAAAVESYREALARFDCPRGLYADADPRWPEDAAFGGVWVDYCGMREATVLAEEAELERLTGHTTRSAGGGGETASPAAPQQERKERPTHGDKVAAGWARRRAAKRQQEEGETMPRGVKLDDGAILAALDTTGRTAKALADKLGVCEGPVSKRLRALERDGRAKKVGGGTGVGPGVWVKTGRKSVPEAVAKDIADSVARLPAGLRVSAAAAQAAKSIDPERGATSEELYGKPWAGLSPADARAGGEALVYQGDDTPKDRSGLWVRGHVGPVFDALAGHILRESKLRAAALMREIADRLDAEAKETAA